MAALPRHDFLSTLAAYYACTCHTPYRCNMAEKGKKHFSAGDVLEAIFQDQDSHDEKCECGPDVEIVEDSEKK